MSAKENSTPLTENSFLYINIHTHMNNNLYYIALWGKKKAGKTTLARQLASELHKQDKRTTRLSFAEKLRQAYRLFFPDSPPWLELDPLTKEAHRSFMQICGDAAKSVDPCYFAKDLVRQAENTFEIFAIDDPENPPPLYVVIDDLRFIEEYEALKNSGRVVVVKLVSDMQDDNDTHRSEAHDGLESITNFTWHNLLRDTDEGKLLCDFIGFYLDT